MRDIPPFSAAVAMPEFDIHLTPPAAAAPPAAANCDPQRCPWWPYTTSKEFKANTALIIVVLVCALICALAFNAAIRYIVREHCRRRRRDEEAEEQKAEQTIEIPSMIYSEEMKFGGAETECIICLSEFSAGDKIRVMEKCNHGFHFHCIQKWLVSHSSCPTCRTNCAKESTASTP